MTLEEVCEYYKSISSAAKAIGISRQSAYFWFKRGQIPYDKQLRFQKDSNGKLIADNSNFPLFVKSDKVYFPMYRYYNDILGMCTVKSIVFKPNSLPKITYHEPNKKMVTFTSFNTDNLMQSSTIKDKNGVFLFEKDIICFDCEDESELKSLDQIYSTNNFHDGIEGIFTIIGNIFEGVKNG